ncbi:excinuclease ABC subunit A [Ornatilinea apprima]|uniref:UvrABC system protein A n=1 Tax=Ornatilinea apprima TaxID=1134406 RepID=A0A0P6XDK9_9CHLR|nr:excinuclease ABC subunit UvrA [Ornatilinea apprima]KPL78312.1 excinuclease ABC subunit A [Ornatilinea apprima]
MTDQINIRGARLHNLKNLSVDIPKGQLVAFTGVSGSGKSTLGFDILLKEGQRQYMESLGLVTYGLSKAPVESISGLSPTISVDQHLTHQNPRSTVGTVTEVYTYLRVLFARLGHRPCPVCGKNVPPVHASAGLDWEDDTDSDADGSGQTFACPHCEAAIPEMGMAFFSFNKPEGACPTCTGLGIIHRVNVDRLLDEEKSIAEGAVKGWDIHYIRHYLNTLTAAASYFGFDFDLSRAVKNFSPAQRDLLFYGANSPQFRRHFPDVEPPATVSKGRFEGIATNVLRRYADRIEDADYREKMEALLVTETCPDCKGTRLRPESRVVTVSGRSIVEVSRMALSELGAWLEGLPAVFSAQEMRLADAILQDLKDRIGRLVETGAGYLTLERSAPSLSAGEAQRLRLANLLGSGLSGLLYVFDEPTIGLHQRDTHKLIEVLKRLRDLGNTVLVIEHDLETIAAADTVIDFGPGAGKHGGRVVAMGTPAQVARAAGSLTGDYLAGRARIVVPKRRRAPNGKALTIRGARHHNLQNLTVSLPLGSLVAVTGVSGSGKSTLVFDIVDRALRQRLYGAAESPGEHDALEGCEYLDKIITIDQEHVGRIPRSNAATYSDAFTAIREAFAATDAARERGLAARHFSFNVPGGRCERCEGSGVLTVKMHFLPDVEVRCPVCHGRRFKPETLSARYKGLDIAQVLDLTVEEALELFRDVPAAASRLQVLADVGLGYLQLGQPTKTLSGGEAQRVKLAKELGRRTSGQTLYLLDEPTTGLHLADTARLLEVLRRLVEAGNSVVVTEHNLEVVKTADWVIDLGPEGGAAGGRLVAEGTPEQVASSEESVTGRYLRGILR